MKADTRSSHTGLLTTKCKQQDWIKSKTEPDLWMFNTIIQKTAVQCTLSHFLSHKLTLKISPTHRVKEHTITIAHIALTNTVLTESKELWLSAILAPAFDSLSIAIETGVSLVAMLILWHFLFTARWSDRGPAQEQQELPELWAPVDLKVNLIYLLMITLPWTQCSLLFSIRVLISTISTMMESTV